MKTRILFVVGILAIATAAGGQTPVPAVRDAQDALHQALDSQRHGDYQRAADLAQEAAAGQANMSPAERQALARLVKENSAALAERRAGAEQLRLALNALRDNRPAEAIDSFKQVAIHEPYLTAADRQTFKPYAEGMHLGAGVSTYQLAAPSGAPIAGNPDQRVHSPYHVIENDPEPVKKATAPAPKEREATAAAPAPAPVPAIPESSKPDVPTTAVLALDPAAAQTAKPTVSSKDTETARVLLAQARKAIETGDLALARRQIALARALRPDLLWYEDNPSRLEAEAARVETRMKPIAAPVAVKDKDASPTDARTRAVALLKQGRTQFNDNKLDDALQTTVQLRTIQGVTWGPFEDSPQRLIQDVYAAYQRRDQEESVKVVAEARKLLLQGDLNGAERSAYRAQTLHGPYSAMDFGDRPEKVLADVGTARGKHIGAPDAPTVSAAGQPLPTAKVAFQPPPFLPPIIVTAAPNAPGVTQAGMEVSTAGEWSATLNKARQELNRGASNEARKLAEKVYTSAQVASAEAETLLRSIDEEEFAQQCLRDQHTFDAASAAYNRGEVAEASRLLRSIDARRLDPARATRLKEMTKNLGASHAPQTPSVAGGAAR